MTATGVALVFPGQGAQSVGMGRDLCEGNGDARAIFAEADRALGIRLSELCFAGPAEELGATVNAQPAILTASVAALAVLRASIGPRLRPVVVSGHSLGEYTALVAAGALDFADAVRLVRERGRLMQAAGDARPGAMAAIVGLPEDTVAGLCREAEPVGIVVIANYNAPDQLVISGEKSAVDAVSRLASSAGARKVVQLAVSGAFHSPLMESAATEFAEALGAVPLRDPDVPVVGNVSAEPLARAGEIRSELARQLRAPVRWVDGVRRMRQLGAEIFVELGPGQVLSGLIRRIEPGVRVMAAGSADGLARAQTMLVGEAV